MPETKNIRQPILSMNDLNIRFTTPDGVVKAVNGIDLDLYSGEILGIVGESGSGKSQTWMAPLGLLADNAQTNGQIFFDNKELLSLSTKDLNSIRSQRISMVFQDPMTSLNPYLRIETQMMEALETHNPQMGRNSAKARCLEMLERVAIPDAKKRLSQYPHELSGGMRQRVMIAMALLNDPDILIADEPTTALDVTIQAEILDIIKRVQAESGMAVVFITHDLGVVAELCHRVCVMYAGRLVEVGPVRDVFEDPQHPYTLSLLRATPRAERNDGASSGGKQKLYAIPGSPPNLGDLPPGCAFEPRCACARSECQTRIPALEPDQSNAHRQKACFRTEASHELAKELSNVG